MTNLTSDYAELYEAMSRAEAMGFEGTAHALRALIDQLPVAALTPAIRSSGSVSIEERC